MWVRQYIIKWVILLTALHLALVIDLSPHIIIQLINLDEKKKGFTPAPTLLFYFRRKDYSQV